MGDEMRGNLAARDVEQIEARLAGRSRKIGDADDVGVADAGALGGEGEQRAGLEAGVDRRVEGGGRRDRRPSCNREKARGGAGLNKVSPRNYGSTLLSLDSGSYRLGLARSMASSGGLAAASSRFVSLCARHP